jgi:phage tail sheath protein FI
MTISADQGSKVIVQEINLSQVITSASTSVVAQVIVSNQGSTSPIQFTNAQNYLTQYGNPNAQISYDVYCGLDYFTEGQTLWGIRAVHEDALYAAVVMYTDGTTTYLSPVTAGVADPTEPDWTALGIPTGSQYYPLALFYPALGPGSYADVYAISIASTQVATPTGLTLASSNTGGSLPAATYEYQVSAIGASGETLATSPATVVIAGSAVTNEVTVTWNIVTGAIGYYVYGRTSSGIGLLATVGQVSPTSTVTTVSFVDQGTITPGTQKPITSPANLPTPSPTFVVNVWNTSQSTSYAVESWTCSYYDYTNSNGLETELEQAINPFSQFIQVTSYIPLLASNVTPPAATSVAQTLMAGGDSGSAPTDSDIINAWQTFLNKQLYQVNILLNSGHAAPDIQLAMDTIAQTRGDCVSLIDVPSASQQFQQAINYRNLQLNLNSTYSALFCPDMLQADTINGKQQYVPFSGWAAALCARTDRVANPSFSIAGLNRGIVNVLGTRYSYDQGEMDSLFQAQVNYTQTFVGQGIALWEQQTMAGQMSALSWLSVRRIVNVIKVALYQFLLYSLQEPNDDFTGRQIVSSCTSYLQSIQNARGISSFDVVSDDSNNTAQDFNSGIRNVTVIIIPVIPIHIINLQVVISQQGVSFTEALSQVSPG